MSSPDMSHEDVITMCQAKLDQSAAFWRDYMDRLPPKEQVAMASVLTNLCLCKDEEKLRACLAVLDFNQLMVIVWLAKYGGALIMMERVKSDMEKTP